MMETLRGGGCGDVQDVQDVLGGCARCARCARGGAAPGQREVHAFHGVQVDGGRAAGVTLAALEVWHALPTPPGVCVFPLVQRLP